MTEAQIDERMLAAFRSRRLVPQLRGATDKDLILERRRRGVIWSPFMDGYAKMIIRLHGSLPGPGTPEWLTWGGGACGTPMCDPAAQQPQRDND